MGDAFLIQNIKVISTIPQNVLTIPATYIDATLTNFPMTVRMIPSDPNWDLIDTSDTVYFTDMSDTQLNHEVEMVDTSLAIYHVCVPSISSSVITQFKMKFNGSNYASGHNPTAVWDSNYVGVYHMGTTTTSTASGNALSFVGGSFVVGLNGQARSFSSGNYASTTINFGSSNQHTHLLVLNPSSTVPDSGDEQLYSVGNEEMLLYTAFGGGGVTRALSTYSPSGTLFNNIPRYSSTAFTRNSYQVLASVINGTTFKCFKNDTVFMSLTGLTSRTLTSQSVNLFRRIQSASTNTTGIIDEYRVSKIARADAWIKAEYEFLINNSLIKEAV